MVQPLGKTAWHFLMKLDIHLPYDLTISFLGIYSRKMKTSTKKDLYTNVHSNFTNNSQTLQATLKNII